MWQARLNANISMGCSVLVIVLNVIVVGASDLNINAITVAIFMIIVSIVKAIQLKFQFDTVSNECHNAKSALRDELLAVRALRFAGDNQDGVPKETFLNVEKNVLAAIQACPSYISIDSATLKESLKRGKTPNDFKEEEAEKRGLLAEQKSEAEQSAKQKSEAEQSAKDVVCGDYILTMEARVRKSEDPADFRSPTETLKAGTRVRVVEVVKVVRQKWQRLRGRLESPTAGWISLVNTENGEHFAERILPFNAQEFGSGYYTLTKEAQLRKSENPADFHSPAETLEAGTHICVAEVVKIERHQRLRARLEGRIAGWITLVNTENGDRFAEQLSPEEAERVAKEEEEFIEKVKTAESLYEELGPGEYILRADTQVRKSEIAADFHSDAETLKAGTRVSVREVFKLDELQRLRARLDSPVAGWITLVNTENGKQFAERIVPWAKELGNGYYTLTKETQVRKSEDPADFHSPAETLEAGTHVRVVEVVRVERQQRLRGRLEGPVAGWFTLVNTESGDRFAEQLSLEEAGRMAEEEAEADEKVKAAERLYEELGPGEYILRKDTQVRKSDKAADFHSDAETLKAGTRVSVREVFKLDELQRLRARLDSPVAGWITLVNTENGDQFAARDSPSAVQEKTEGKTDAEKQWESELSKLLLTGFVDAIDLGTRYTHSYNQGYHLANTILTCTELTLNVVIMSFASISTLSSYTDPVAVLAAVNAILKGLQMKLTLDVKEVESKAVYLEFRKFQEKAKKLKTKQDLRTPWPAELHEDLLKEFEKRSAEFSTLVFNYAEWLDWRERTPVDDQSAV